MILDVISYEIQEFHLKLHVDLSCFMEILMGISYKVCGEIFCQISHEFFSVKFYNCWTYAVRLYVKYTWVGH